MPSLTLLEARTRAAEITVTSMTVTLDLDQGEDVFGSRTRIAFRTLGRDVRTVVDVRPVTLHRVTLNGTDLPPEDLADGRYPLAALRDTNVLEVEATMGYSHDGQGLHRATDPADGEDYVYGHLFLDAAPRVFACFDQPDLKAPYAVSVTAPGGWRVLGNGHATEVAPGRWEFATTKPLATYFVTVCAGPWVSVEAEHDGIPLGIHARASLKEHLERQGEQILTVTRQSFDYLHELFGIRYPFGDYHQVFVPEFNAGAMENPGCVTIRDPYVYRGAAAEDEVLLRSNTISHEMAHMWFGDLVTMRWWDDLWLNESFAEYMAYRTSVDATGYPDAWVEATVHRKAWGYAAERTPSTHPVAGAPAPDGDTALQNFDGISYAKGASVLRQLIAHIGDGAFVAGVRAYLSAHAYGNGEFADFLAALESSSGRSLADWSAEWLQTAGADRIALDPATGAVTRTPPLDHPADRPHTFDIAGYDDGVESWRVTTTVEADDSTVDGTRPAEVVVPNAGDLTWATVALDGATLRRLPDTLASVPDPQARAVVWMALVDGMCLAEIDPRHVLRVFESAWPAETDPAIVSRVAAQVTGRVVAQFLPDTEQPGATARVAAAARRLLESAVESEGLGLAAARVLARTGVDVDELHRWSRGVGVPAGLGDDADLRWVVVTRLAELGAVDEAAIAAFADADRTMTGALGALTARAARPTAEAKAAAWADLTRNRDRSNYELNAIATGLWMSAPRELQARYAERYFTDIPQMQDWVGEDALARVAVVSYPSRFVDPSVVERGAEALARADLSPAARRAIVDCDSRMRESLRSRRTFG